MEITIKKQINSKEDFELLLKDYSIAELSDGINHYSEFKTFLQPWADAIFVYQIEAKNLDAMKNILNSEVVLDPTSITSYLEYILGRIEETTPEGRADWLGEIFILTEYLDRIGLEVGAVSSYIQSEEFKTLVLSGGDRILIEKYTGGIVCRFHYSSSWKECRLGIDMNYNIFDEFDGELPSDTLFETEVVNLISAFADKTVYDGDKDFFIFPNRETFEMVKEKCREIGKTAFAQLRKEFEMLVSMGQFVVEFKDNYGKKYIETIVPPTSYEFVAQDKVHLKYPFSADEYHHYLSVNEFGIQDGKENSLWKYVNIWNTSRESAGELSHGVDPQSVKLIKP